MPKLPNHLHTLERSSTNLKVYRCIHPDCTFFQRVEFIVGKRALCKCGIEYIVDRQQAIKQKNKSLVCANCSKSKKNKKLKETSDFLKDIFTDLETSIINGENENENEI